MFANACRRAIQLGSKSAGSLKVASRRLTTQAIRSNGTKLIVAGGVVGAGVLFSSTLAQQSESSSPLLNKFIAAAGEKVPLTGLPGTKYERTFIAIKPDGVQRNLVGEVVSRFEKKGYKLVAIKILTPTKQFAEQHYSDLAKRPFFPSLVTYFSSGPVVAMIWEGRGVIAGGRRLVGATNPDEAQSGSVRGDLAVDIGRNIIHGSDSADSAQKEIALWFNEKEAATYESNRDKWVHEK
jgi:nucleoside-diphosphate kinase